MRVCYVHASPSLRKNYSSVDAILIVRLRNGCSPRDPISNTFASTRREFFADDPPPPTLPLDPGELAGLSGTGHETRGLWTGANGPVTQFACSIVRYSLSSVEF
ncbi:hypothetical protein K0M31_018847 [Melipona bicolor]|uniref:Uncharacterized protein n=1 Tax=Melipona bicolor TaxID=60889 RepID=A0AA40KS29_9HYME|nr:hypothetical protein K0M31_018847 [Melipona bicolor]